jgi:hypothetical protein
MYAYCQEMPGVTAETAARVEVEVGEAPVAGLIAHVSGPTTGGWRIIDVWESEDDFNRFQAERLNPALQVARRGVASPGRPFASLSVTSAESLARRS